MWHTGGKIEELLRGHHEWDRTNQIAVLLEMQVMEEWAREKRKNVAKNSVAATMNECIVMARTRRDFHNLQLTWAMERSRRCGESF